MHHVLSAGTLLGDDVKNRENEDLGKIEEIMLDAENGRISYAVVSFGGFLGIGDKYFAVPWEKLSLDTENECFRLDVPRETLENAPGFDKDNWPNFANQEWGANVYNHYNVTPYWN